VGGWHAAFTYAHSGWICTAHNLSSFCIRPVHASMACFRPVAASPVPLQVAPYLRSLLRRRKRWSTTWAAPTSLVSKALPACAICYGDAPMILFFVQGKKAWGHYSVFLRITRLGPCLVHRFAPALDKEKDKVTWKWSLCFMKPS
jgi:hypothetical protein